MINEEILYERNLTGSYMKIPVAEVNGFDEKILLKRKLPGLLSVEKCYVNGDGQYWYNISGKQSLDTYCKVKSIGIELIERMIISICNQIEILELNLVDINCLILVPELIFITNQNSEVIFTVYPGANSLLMEEFQNLMEYLITKVDHTDAEAVRAAYEIYEKSLDDTYSIMDIRNSIIQKKEPEPPKKEIDSSVNINSIEEKNIESHNDKSIMGYILENSTFRSYKKTIGKYFEPITKFVGRFQHRGKKNNEEDRWIIPEVVDFNDEPEMLYQSNPTVCLNMLSVGAQGMLLYEGNEEYENILINDKTVKLGKSNEVDVMINKPTISNYHAKIEREDNNFYIEDLNSTNGTMVNGEALSYKERRKLEINDLVQLADLKYRFV